MELKEKVLTRRHFLQNTFMSLSAPGVLGVNAIGRLLNPFGEPSDMMTGGLEIGKDSVSTAPYEKKLSFYNTHTGEFIKNIVFWAKDSKGGYVGDNLHRINKLFRDHRTGDVITIDLRLLELLHKLQQKIDVSAPFHLISGYRSARTNAMLCEKSSGVAKVSQHTFGRAADISLPKTCTLQYLYKAARSLGLGGVGCYSQFVHVDVGRVRYW